MPSPTPSGSSPPAPSHYERLQVSRTAGPQDLRQAFRSLSKRYHPDTTSLPPQEAESAFQGLQLAYAVLSDPVRRRAYDDHLKRQEAPAVPSPPPSVRPAPRPASERRALSGGEWFALLLLALAFIFSLVLGLGLAWARGSELMQRPSWWNQLHPPSSDPVAMIPAPLPADDTPLYNHSLPDLEAWLRGLGARQEGPRAPGWDLKGPDWSARIDLEIEEFKVSWQRDGRTTVRHFPYGLSRADVQAAILAGP